MSLLLRRFNLGCLPILLVMGVVAGCSDDTAPGPGWIEHGSDTNVNPSNGSDENKDTETGDETPTDTAPDLNLCYSATPPSYCMMINPPACGDGKVNVDGEECDDGDNLPGDGCNGLCKEEKYFDCPDTGGECVSTLICGDGNRDPGELCDDGNTDPDDGCSPDCREQDLNYDCSEPGKPCVRIVTCGDGRINGTETCEDDDPKDALMSGDGCSAECMIEPGWNCVIPGKPCTPVEVCGDGKFSAAIGEACDDGNKKDGDGCSADCSNVEDDYICEHPGQPCVYTARCGDGERTLTEACDDKNTSPGDGCDAECKIEEGYACPFPGAPCIPVCGDGHIILNEACDDGALVDDDGCSSKCQLEEGWSCTGSVKDNTWECHKTQCGDGKVEGAEGCEDGNNTVGDGCTPFCELEPSCNGIGACTSECGDGIILKSDGEDCDDGNARAGDGCSAACKVEQGYRCHQPPLGGTLAVPIVLRDFRTAHEDFQFPGESSGDVAWGRVDAAKGLVSETLDAEGKPVFVGTGTTYVQNGLIHSASSFATWYRDPADANATVVTELVLFDDGAGNYVNRFGDDGTKWERLDMEYDGNPVFFPLDGEGITPESEYSVAKIPPFYFGLEAGEDPDTDCHLGQGCNPCWPPECAEGETMGVDCVNAGQTIEDYPCYDDSPLHNFHFTSQVVYWFQYDEDVVPKLGFVGDDDLWVFLNGQLALDLGGIHIALEDTLEIDKATAAKFGLENGKVYQIMVFHAERQTYASTYKLTLSGFNASPSVCEPICGDGIPSPGEECDDGEELNIGGYGHCEPDCTRGPYCGDGDPNGPEECDNGVNRDAYGSDGCAPGCVLPPFCGDGHTQTSFGETCDNKVNDGSYNGCTPQCKKGPYCGDGTPNGDEACDDGINDGSYGNCAPGCVDGPHCGDGVVNGPEECDFNDPNDDGTCSPNCRNAGCGDGATQHELGEKCDEGTDAQGRSLNTGEYGHCGPDCLPGPHCGDGFTQTEHEECDDGENKGEYGGCAPGCKWGPRCGDGIRQPAFEECDEESPYCSPNCKKVIVDVY